MGGTRLGLLLVVRPEALGHRGAGFVEADHLDLSAMPAGLEDDPVERANDGDVSEMGLGHVDHDAIHLRL